MNWRIWINEKKLINGRKQINWRKQINEKKWINGRKQISMAPQAKIKSAFFEE